MSPSTFRCIVTDPPCRVTSGEGRYLASGYMVSNGRVSPMATAAERSSARTGLLDDRPAERPELLLRGRRHPARDPDLARRRLEVLPRREARQPLGPGHVIDRAGHDDRAIDTPAEHRPGAADLGERLLPVPRREHADSTDQEQRLVRRPGRRDERDDGGTPGDARETTELLHELGLQAQRDAFRAL